MARDKAAHERTVFEDFARAASLAVEAGSVASQPEPRPDIACRISGEARFFELSRIADQTKVETIVESLRRLLRGDRRPTGGVGSFDRPLVRSLTNKTSKAYATGGVQVDLLLYYDSEPPTFDFPPPQFPEWAERYLVPRIKANPGCFSRVWVFDRNEQRVLWRCP